MARANLRNRVSVDARLLAVLRVYTRVTGASVEEQVDLALRDYIINHSPTIEQFENTDVQGVAKE